VTLQYHKAILRDLRRLCGASPARATFSRRPPNGRPEIAAARCWGHTLCSAGGSGELSEGCRTRVSPNNRSESERGNRHITLEVHRASTCETGAVLADPAVCELARRSAPPARLARSWSPLGYSCTCLNAVVRVLMRVTVPIEPRSNVRSLGAKGLTQLRSSPMSRRGSAPI
jgi:hypothetical protein